MMDGKQQIASIRQIGLYSRNAPFSCERGRRVCVVGENSHNVLQLGDEVMVRVKNADLERKQLDFEFLRTAEEGD